MVFDNNKNNNIKKYNFKYLYFILISLSSLIEQKIYLSISLLILFCFILLIFIDFKTIVRMIFITNCKLD